MSLSERSRSALYLGLVGAVGNERAVEEMLSYFPARDVEEPVTKEFLRAEMAVQRAEVQAEFAAVRSEMSDGFAAVDRGFAAVRSEMSDGTAAVDGGFVAVRSEMSGGFAAVDRGFAAVRSEVSDGLAAVRSEKAEGSIAVDGGFVAVRSEMTALASDLRTEMHVGFQRQMAWMITMMVTINGLLVAAVAALR